MIEHFYLTNQEAHYWESIVCMTFDLLFLAFEIIIFLKKKKEKNFR